ncbi:MAG: hypothetical protein M3P41_06940 [Actinomycetota bacterium]|nr:hypothetical protein [Actinomycetota bacterium]
MGRRHLTPTVALSLALALALAGVAVALAAAATGLRWSPLAKGGAEPTGAQDPIGYLALSKRAEQRWSARIEAAQRSRVGGVDFSHRAVVVAFLDGRPCAGDPEVAAVARVADTLTVHVAFTRPPIGVATCVRTSTAYVVVTIARSAFGRSVPARVRVDARARA